MSCIHRNKLQISVSKITTYKCSVMMYVTRKADSHRVNQFKSHTKLQRNGKYTYHFQHYFSTITASSVFMCSVRVTINSG